jgi:hypothetical protein
MRAAHAKLGGQNQLSSCRIQRRFAEIRGKLLVGAGKPATIGSGCDAHQLAERRGEMSLVGEPERIADLRQGQLGLSNERLGALDPPLHDVTVRGRTGALAELNGEMVGAQPCQRRQILQPEHLRQMRLDVGEHAPQARARQATPVIGCGRSTLEKPRRDRGMQAQDVWRWALVRWRAGPTIARVNLFRVQLCPRHRPPLAGFRVLNALSCILSQYYCIRKSYWGIHTEHGRMRGIDRGPPTCD